MITILKEERRKNNRRHTDELEATIKENVARLGLENTISITIDRRIPSVDSVDSSKIEEEYEAFKTDPRRI